MTTTAREKYQATAVGATATLQPASKQSDGSFQSDVREVQRMQEEGLVTITIEHCESESGRRLIDLIAFRRVR
ncbi:hypothetical protein [Massilia soli]|uniref:Uncharacterized protein n=1 Tax=Massilia soli TaxID=2792854 RepID=A0ABS7SLR9_9BURK|nr:hypothetical protein [Massilia soli]MBZ2207128.1 hypothetical protein [Massilia soli]